jgi:hypothetical protein
MWEGIRATGQLEFIKKYKCSIYIFEPVNNYFNYIKERFKKVSKIRVFNFGLSDKSATVKFYLNEDGTSAYKTSTKTVSAELFGIEQFIKKSYWRS